MKQEKLITYKIYSCRHENHITSPFTITIVHERYKGRVGKFSIIIENELIPNGQLENINEEIGFSYNENINGSLDPIIRFVTYEKILCKMFKEVVLLNIKNEVIVIEVETVNQYIKQLSN